jgi:hypothetical protein
MGTGGGVAKNKERRATCVPRGSESPRPLAVAPTAGVTMFPPPAAIAATTTLVSFSRTCVSVPPWARLRRTRLLVGVRVTSSPSSCRPSSGGDSRPLARRLLADLFRGMVVKSKEGRQLTFQGYLAFGNGLPNKGGVRYSEREIRSAPFHPSRVLSSDLARGKSQEPRGERESVRPQDQTPTSNALVSSYDGTVRSSSFHGCRLLGLLATVESLSTVVDGQLCRLKGRWASPSLSKIVKLWRVKRVLEGVTSLLCTVC